MPTQIPRPVSARLRDAATLMPLLGLFLLIPPAISLFDDGLLGGVPAIVAYVFGVWLALILGTALIAWRLGRAAPPASEPPP